MTPSTATIAILAPTGLSPVVGLAVVLVDILGLVVTRRRDGGHGDR